MTITELIAKLEEVKAEHGNILVAYDDGVDGWAIFQVTDVTVQKDRRVGIDVALIE